MPRKALVIFVAFFGLLIGSCVQGCAEKKPEEAGSEAAPAATSENSASPESESADSPQVTETVAKNEAAAVKGIEKAVEPDKDKPADPVVEETPVELAKYGTVTALSEEERATFWGSAEDAEPEFRKKNVHFWAGNEANLQVFRKDIEHLGGGYMGVGSDQGYLFIGWQRPELVWLTDYDPAISTIHEVHRAFFLAAKTPREFMALWESPERGLQVLRESVAAADREGAEAAYEKAHVLVYRRLRKVRNEMKRAKAPCYLNDQETYEWIGNMYRAERIRPMLGNLIDTVAIAGVGEAARRLRVPVRVVYFSNAEQYWDYGDEFRKNMAALNIDERSVVLRTLAIGERDDEYKYIVHPIRNFLGWLQEPSIKNVYAIRRSPVERGGVDFSVVKRNAREYIEGHSAQR